MARTFRSKFRKKVHAHNSQKGRNNSSRVAARTALNDAVEDIYIEVENFNREMAHYDE